MAETSFSALTFGFSSESIGAVSVSDISQNEKRHRGKWSPNKMADTCWSLVRETPTGENKRQERTN